MSISTTQKPTQIKRDSVLRATGVTAKVIEKLAKKVKQDVFGSLALFAVVLTGLGLFFGKEFNVFWYVLTLILVGGAFYEKFWGRVEVTGTPTKLEIKK